MSKRLISFAIVRLWFGADALYFICLIRIKMRRSYLQIFPKFRILEKFEDKAKS